MVSPTLYLITPPSAEPVTIAEAKEHCRVDLSNEDNLLDGLIAAARMWAEQYKGQALVTQTWDLKLRAFPCGRLEIPLGPLQSVTSVKYLDGAGVEQTWDAAKYSTHGLYVPVTKPAGPDPKRGWIEPVYGQFWPIALPVDEAVRVRFTAGWGTAAQVPQRFKQAMLLRLAQLYAQREPVVAGTAITLNDTKADEALLWPPSF